MRFLSKILLLSILVFYSKTLFAAQILSSIKPIDSLVRMIVKDSKTVDLVVNDNSSPHGFNLKPSHLKMLNEADIIFYIDDEFEGFIPKIVDSNPKLKKIQLLPNSDLRIWSLRFENQWESKIAQKGDKNIDHHVWLDTKNAKKMLGVIKEELSKLYPENATLYSKNHKEAVEKIDDLYKEIDKKMAIYKDRKFMVYHDGFQYFERQFNLNNIGVIANNPMHNVSIKSLKKNALKAKIGNIDCVFSEPQFNDKFSNMIANASGSKVVKIDPIGFNLQPSSDLYLTLIRNVASSFDNCFTK